MRSARILVLAVVAGLVAACAGTTATTAPTAAPTTAVVASSGPTAAPTATPNPFAGMTVTASKSGDHAFDDVSLSHWIQELKDQYGITLNLTGVDSADTSLRAVVSGAQDLAVAQSLTGLVNLVQQSGSDVKLIAADTYGSDYQIVSKSSINGVSDLAGKTEGISAPGDASELVSHLCLNNQGFDYPSLKIVRVGGTGARVAALLAGQIDIGAAHIADAKDAVAKSNGALKILFDCGKVVGNYPVTGMVARGEWLKQNPELAQVLVNTYVDSMRWAATNKDEYLKAATTWVPDSPPRTGVRLLRLLQEGGLLAHQRRHRPPVPRDVPWLRCADGRRHGARCRRRPWVDDSFVNKYLAANGTQ